MAFPWLAVSVGAQIFGGLLGASASDRAAEDAKRLGKLNASYITEETAEQTRRLKFTQERTQASVRAGQAASGFRSGEKSMGASSKAFMSTLKDVQQSELDWLNKAGKSRAEIARRGGEAQASTLRAQGVSQLFSGAAGAASTVLQYG